MPWLAAREVEVAAGIWRDHPQDAYDRLDRARSLNPLSDRPDLVAGAIAARRDDRPKMREAFLNAAERNPHNWYAHLELAIVAALDGRREEALSRLDQAHELNPSEAAIPLIRRQVRRGQLVSPRTVDRMFLQRVQERTS
jgi:tetratricopeptide (TPR) repeat protein